MLCSSDGCRARALTKRSISWLSGAMCTYGIGSQGCGGGCGECDRPGQGLSGWSLRSGSALTKLRGLPYNTTETEIAEFFEGFQTTLIHICRRDGDRVPLKSMACWAERAG